MHEKNSQFFEMSRYINLDLYHRVEESHPFYRDMIDEISTQISRLCSTGKKYRILELGAGTGLLTKKLIGFPFLDVHALEIDADCCEILRNNINSENLNIIQGDAVVYCRNNYFDIVISSFAHDHIHYEKANSFARNIEQNLRGGGVYIMGGEIIPSYSTMEERKEALYKYHCYIINKALLDGNFDVAQIEIQALMSGLEMKGDFKRHEDMFEDEMASTDLTLVSKKKIGPGDNKSVGGIFVYVYRA